MIYLFLIHNEIFIAVKSKGYVFFVSILIVYANYRVEICVSTNGLNSLAHPNKKITR